MEFSDDWKKEEEEDTIGCMSCMSTTDLCDLFAVYAENVHTYAKMFEICFNLKVSDDLKYICTQCTQKLEDAIAFKEQTAKTMIMLQGVKADEEYLDEKLLAEDEKGPLGHKKSGTSSSHGVIEEGATQILDSEDENVCAHCNVKFPSLIGMNNHIRVVHGIQPKEVESTSEKRECELCSAVFLTNTTLQEHLERCHGVLKDGEGDDKLFPCHFCDNVYTGRKACYTHLRMKHGLKLSTESMPKVVRRERKFCHICQKDFSQKQILNKHLWKEHGYEVEKRKAYICPLCDERVSYGSHFDRHLANEHSFKQKVLQLEFRNMDEFILYKTQVQEETKCRFRKTTASKPTIEGLRSHYMCSQSGMYVYQGKGLRPAPERQIYKTGKACPAHMVLTETVDRVMLTFHATHVGHGACPYYEPRPAKRIKMEPASPTSNPDISDNEGETVWVCDTCGLSFNNSTSFRNHAASHGPSMYPCRLCDSVFQNLDAWSRHFRSEHEIQSLY